MSKIAYFHAFSGASGDMFLGALVDAGWPSEELRGVLERLPLRGYGLDVKKVVKGTIAATKVSIHAENDHVERGLAEIEAIVRGGELPVRVRERAEAMFQRLARAESTVHGVPVDQIHFHEVGAVDSILDVVGAAAGLEWLGADEIVVSPLNTGGGVVNTLGGKIPVPGMATLLLAQEASAPIYSTSTTQEFLTTTGALVLTSAATAYGPMPRMRVQSVGYGAGAADFDLPNVLRVVIGESELSADADTATVIETNLDDFTPQGVAYVTERLLEQGALDVYSTPILMKKGRPAVKISVIAAPGAVDGMIELLFAETSTLGVRMYDTVRRKLAREQRKVRTPWGQVRVKVSYMDSRLRDVAPEYDDCRALARTAGVPLWKVMEAARRAGLAEEAAN